MDVENLKGIAIGAVLNNNKKYELTTLGETINQQANGKILAQLNLGKALKIGDTRLFWQQHPNYEVVCVVSLGERSSLTYDENEEIDNGKESVRVAAAAATRALCAVGVDTITLDDFNEPEAAAEGSHLSLWSFDEYRTKKDVHKPKVLLHKSNGSFEIGRVKADAQNFARKLANTPANLMTPTIFADLAEKTLTPLGVSVIKHGYDWIKSEGMNLFLSVAQGSVQPPVFLEVAYNNSNVKDEPPYVLVGKGITFDSGGISLKPSAGMDEMRGDMGGAACVISAIKAIAELKLPVNVIGLTPLTENLPSGTATKPGDIFIAKNGKSVCVDNTDAEGRLVLADALCYAEKFQPKLIVDVATLTGACLVSLGYYATGVFSNSTGYYEKLRDAGKRTGDRMWRLPLWKCYKDEISQHSAYDLNNCGSRWGGSCKAAGFLSEFVPANVSWMHLDICSVSGIFSDSKPSQAYLCEGMTGRPTRTLVEFIAGKP